jgi:hypothetical protein
MIDITVRCKGSWMLGTACGKCPACADEALKMMPSLVADNKKLSPIIGLIRPIPEYGDYSDAYKARAYDEARRVLYDKQA